MVLQATEEGGFRPTGELTQLNSYENRVFDLRLEKEKSDRERVIVKFYRPGRWSREALLEEHQFLQELKDEGFAVAEALTLNNGSTLGEKDGLYFSLFPKVQGRLPAELLETDLKKVGRLLAQVHNIGARKPFLHRPIMGQTPYSPWETLDFLQEKISPELWPRYEAAVIELLERWDTEVDQDDFQRIHGDCHRGNLISFGQEMTLLDFDDCGMGPAIQDFWMLFTTALGDDEFETLVTAYEELRAFPREQIHLVPLLRGLRILSYSAWIARRWEDPIFPKIFPNFGTYAMWAEETEAMEKIVWSVENPEDESSL